MKVCEYHERCGGCQYQGIPYEHQCRLKQQEIEQLFKPMKVESLIQAQDLGHYRHKVIATFSMSANKKVIAGIYQEKTHRIIAVQDCMIQSRLANQIIKSLCVLANRIRLVPYDEDRRTGLLRHVQIRVSHKDQKALVTLVLGSKIFPSRKEFLQQLREMNPQIVSIVLNYNNRKTSVVLGQEEKVVFGKGFVVDELCQTKFQISSRSFYQINPVQTEKLYRAAIDMADLSKEDTVLDAYCGIGTISLIVSKQVKQVTGVEINNQAVQDAWMNAKLNGITNVQFVASDVVAWMNENRYDVVFLDPPRSGCDQSFIQAVAKMSPRKIVYISCNPLTQKRDVQQFKKLGYHVKKIQPVDLFCFTEHIENICLLEKDKT